MKIKMMTRTDEKTAEMLMMMTHDDECEKQCYEQFCEVGDEMRGDELMMYENVNNQARTFKSLPNNTVADEKK